MNDKNAHARGWLLKADSDLQTARRMLETGGPYDTACFHTQQAAEKALKAFLAWHEQVIPRTHNLEELHGLAGAIAPNRDLAALDLAQLTAYAVEMRYDFEFWPDQATAAQAVELAERVRELVVAALPAAARP